ncbi:hypothetical protein FSARC_7832 [Fusarium sarcochroum]|uniref:Major facilitator superfamily (MFS) profile domain-containing protein n=1 Tax=Fusarium sarcochroum TaxID=1208366 RepID=A0A8H4TU41_9HYPO|nr:hypothetical protein FSARC_7832 [Fusarium sarcochroum]
MYGPSMVNTTYQGAIVSVYNAGQAIGGLTTGYVAGKFSRKYTILLASISTIIGAVLQRAAVNIGAFASGDGQWRIPLAMQLPIPIILCVIIFFVPFSLRWLVLKDRHEEARQVLASLHGKADEEIHVDRELVQIREQIQLEREQGNLNWTIALGHMFSRKYVRRTLTASFIVTMSQLSGSSVIQNFQSVFYQTVGFTGRTALLISGVYGMMGAIGQVIYLIFVADKLPRTRTLWVGSLVLSSMIAICMALSAQSGSADNSNQAGARAAIASIFIYSLSYAIFFNAMVWVVPSELFRLFLRTKGLASAVASKSVIAIVLSQVTPLALADVSWRYYSLFIASNLAAAIFYFFFLPETSGKSLEEIAALFGDEVVVSSNQAEAKLGHDSEFHELENKE